MAVSTKMSCALSIFTILLLINLPIEIGCCSLNTYDIISLMYQNPNFQNDPCYIEWKAAEDAKLNQILIRREQLEKSMLEQSRKTMEYEARERENRHRSYSSDDSNVQKQKSASASLWKIIGILAGIIVGVCLCAACVAALQSDDNPTITTNNGLSETTPVQLSSVATSNTRRNQTTANENNSTNQIVSSSSVRQQSEINVPLMPKRQDSLPSYEDAIRMPSAPPTE